MIVPRTMIPGLSLISTVCRMAPLDQFTSRLLERYGSPAGGLTSTQNLSPS